MGKRSKTKIISELHLQQDNFGMYRDGVIQSPMIKNSSKTQNRTKRIYSQKSQLEEPQRSGQNF